MVFTALKSSINPQNFSSVLRNFPQAKLVSEINVPFLLNEHGDLYFLSHNNSVILSSLS